MMISHPEAAGYEADPWLKVTGKIKITRYNGHEIMIIQDQSVESIPPPETPYVYPDYDFGL